MLITSSVSVRPRKGTTSANPLLDDLFVYCYEVSVSEVMSSIARGAVVGTGMADNDKLFEQVGSVFETR